MTAPAVRVGWVVSVHLSAGIQFTTHTTATWENVADSTSLTDNINDAYVYGIHALADLDAQNLMLIYPINEVRTVPVYKYEDGVCVARNLPSDEDDIIERGI